MATKISQPIVGYSVVGTDQPSEGQESVSPGKDAATTNVVQMHERLERPEALVGATYKLKSPVIDHAMYITINDIVLNAGTEHEHRRPFEIFVNSKNMDHFQWIVALTRIISAVFRKGGDIAFLVEELKAVFDPRGGYFRKGGQYMPSLVAEIGDVIERHLRSIGMLPDQDLEARQLDMLAEKRAAFESAGEGATPDGAGRADAQTEFPPGAVMCGKCFATAVVQMDGCMTCLSCGDSKCG